MLDKILNSKCGNYENKNQKIKRKTNFIKQDEQILSLSQSSKLALDTFDIQKELFQSETRAVRLTRQ